MKAAVAVSVTLNVALAAVALILALMARKLNRDLIARERERYPT